MAKVRKAKYLYQDGVYYEIGGNDSDAVDQVARDAAAAAQATADAKPDIDDATPSSGSVYSSEQTEERISGEVAAAVADFVSFAEDQTARTDAEKAQARANINAERPWTLVWENASPASAFAAQTVALDLSGFDEFACDYKTDVSGGTPVKRAFARMNERFVLQYFTTDSSKMYPKIRTGEISSTGVAFSDNRQYTTTSNTYNKPYRIYAR